MEKELQLKLDAATVQLRNAETSGDLRDALVLRMLLDSVKMLATKPPH
jgi:hypothetical protein